MDEEAAGPDLPQALEAPRVWAVGHLPAHGLPFLTWWTSDDSLGPNTPGHIQSPQPQCSGHALSGHAEEGPHQVVRVGLS